MQPSIIPLIYLSTHSSAGEGREEHTQLANSSTSRVVEPGMNSIGVNADIILTHSFGVGRLNPLLSRVVEPGMNSIGVNAAIILTLLAMGGFETHILKCSERG